MPKKTGIAIVTVPVSSKRPDETPAPTPLDPQMPVVMLDGYEYVGYVEIPVLGLKLPVMSEWDYSRLKLAPCRQFGSSRTDDLVIAAHNYESHFGHLKDLSAGDTVTFTDMEGIVNNYCVEKIETLNPNEVDAVQNNGVLQPRGDSYTFSGSDADGKVRLTHGK